jgi:hypothetical protein
VKKSQEATLPKKEPDILKGMNVPWITKDGYFDFTKFPIDPILNQSLSNEEQSFRSACSILASMHSAGRPEAAVYLYGLFVLNKDDIKRKELIIEASGQVKTTGMAAILFDELHRIESSSSTRVYIDLILKNLSHFPLSLVKDGFDKLLDQERWSYRMKQKFRKILDQIRYKDL